MMVKKYVAGSASFVSLLNSKFKGQDKHENKHYCKVDTSEVLIVKADCICK